MTVPLRGRLLRRFVSTGFACTVYTATLHAGPRDQAKRMYDRLTGVPPTEAVLNQMENLIKQNKPEDAARIAIESSYFYNVGLKNWVNTWTNVEQNPDVPLNDFSATVIGTIRDDGAFDRILYDDTIYVGTGVANLPAYSPLNNTHYQTLDTQRADLKTVLQKQTQSTVTGIAETAGIITTRAFGEAYFNMGTNRRALRFLFMNFMCNDFEQLSDTTRPDYRVRQDVERNPGGDSTVYRNKCAGCHAGMDGMAGAFAYYEFKDGRTVYQPGVVQAKYFINSNNFPEGYVTTDDSWINQWAEGPNSKLGWSGNTTGNGARELGQMLAASEAFPKCMAERVFTKVCLRKPAEGADKDAVNALAGNFKEAGFSMKKLFAQTAVTCMGE